MAPPSDHWKPLPAASKHTLREYALDKAGRPSWPVIITTVIGAGVAAWLEWHGEAWGWLRVAAAALAAGSVTWGLLYTWHRYHAPAFVMGEDYRTLSNSYERIVKELEEARWALNQPTWGTEFDPQKHEAAKLSQVYRRVLKERDDALLQVAELKERLPDSSGLNVHIAPIEPHLWDELKQHSELSSSRGYLLVFADLSITNRSDQDMSLDFAVSLRLLEPAMLPKQGPSVEVSPILLEGRRKPFHDGLLGVPAKQSRTTNMAFLYGEIDAMTCRGPQNIADDGHSLRIDDRVSGRALTLSFSIYRSPIISITRNPFAGVSDPKAAALRETVEPQTSARLLDVHVAIGEAVIEDGPKEYSNDSMDYGHLLVLRDVAVTNRSDIDMTLDYKIDLALRGASERHPGSGYVRAYPLKIPGSLLHSGYLEVPARKTRTIVIGMLLPQLAAAAAGGIENIANQGHMIWFSDRVSSQKSVKHFTLIRLGLDVQ